MKETVNATLDKFIKTLEYLDELTKKLNREQMINFNITNIVKGISPEPPKPPKKEDNEDEDQKKKDKKDGVKDNKEAEE